MKPINSVSEKHSRDGGYTLLEMAIALLVLGLITAGFFQGYSVYLRQKEIRTTDDNIKLAVAELQNFRDLYGYFPCPAPLTAQRNDENYGRSTSCRDTSVPIGTVPAAGASGTGGMQGIGIVSSARTVTDENGAVYTPRVRIGALPFRDINIAERSTYDGYGSRLVYALTERNGDLDTYGDREGGIGIIDASTPTGASLVQPPNSAIFALVSPGRDRVGGVDQQGNIVPCSAGAPESENCDLGTNAVFRSIPESNATGRQFDDRLTFFTPSANTLWVRMSGANENHIIDTHPGNIGVGNLNPVAKLDIADSSNTVDQNNNPKPEGTLRATDRINTDIVCPSTGGTVGANANCFEPRNIAGDNTTNPANNTPGNGMRCPAGQYMNGIQDGRAICSPVAVRCDGAIDMMTGINPTTGAPTCTTIPCRAQNVTICSTSRTLSAGPFNGTQSITGGSNRVQNYACRANAANTSVSWVNTGNSGSCNCTASDTTTTIACGPGYNGSYTSRTVCSCPSGTCTTTSTQALACTALNCISQPDQVSSVNCPSGYTGGPVVTTRRWQCAPTPRWVTTTSGSCQCAPRVPNTQTINTGACPDGFTGPGTTQPQIWSTASCSWVNNGPAVTSCTCDASETRTFQRDPACQPSEHVTRQATVRETRTGANCTWANAVEVDPGACAPNTYRWKQVGQSGSPPVTGVAGEIVGPGCTYSQSLRTETTTCSRNLSGNLYMVLDCLCQP